MSVKNEALSQVQKGSACSDEVPGRTPAIRESWIWALRSLSKRSILSLYSLKNLQPPASAPSTPPRTPQPRQPESAATEHPFVSILLLMLRGSSRSRSSSSCSSTSTCVYVLAVVMRLPWPTCSPILAHGRPQRAAARRAGVAGLRRDRGIPGAVHARATAIRKRSPPKALEDRGRGRGHRAARAPTQLEDDRRRGHPAAQPVLLTASRRATPVLRRRRPEPLKFAEAHPVASSTSNGSRYGATGAVDGVDLSAVGGASSLFSRAAA